MKTFTACLLLLYVSHDALGQVVTVHEGAESVSLPFFMSPPLENSPSVLWKRGLEEVHFRDGHGDDFRKQSPEFKDRTRMNPDAFQTGDLTLVLMKPTINDTGIYSCVVREGITEVRRTTVALSVQPKKAPPFPVGAVVGAVAVVLLLVFVAVVLWWKLRSKVIAYEGEDSVSLPVHISSCLLFFVSSVEWRRWSETVHLREQQGDVLSGQSDEFKDRTEMKPDALETGDLTLVLKHPRDSDRGIYSCVVKVCCIVVRHFSVELIVNVKQVTVYEGEDSVSLPVRIRRCHIPSSQPSVEWRRGTETVHLREQQGDVLSGQSDKFKDRTEMKPDALKTGILTLVLKGPRFSDRGIYSCEVKEGSTVVRDISVELRVEVTSLASSVPHTPPMTRPLTENLQLSGVAEETSVEMEPLLDRNNSAPGDNSAL